MDDGELQILREKRGEDNAVVITVVDCSKAGIKFNSGSSGGEQHFSRSVQLLSSDRHRFG